MIADWNKLFPDWNKVLTYQPSHKPDCTVPSKLRADALQLVAVRQTNGRRLAVLQCLRCKDRGTFIPHSVVNPLGLPIVRDHLTEDACDRCGSTAGVERHHWAPVSIFGQDADTWPMALLCPDCHREWHETMRLWRKGITRIRRLVDASSFRERHPL